VDWFALHSGQNFWLVAVAFLAAAFVSARTARLTPVAVGVCITGAVASLAFMVLDARTPQASRRSSSSSARTRTTTGRPCGSVTGGGTGPNATGSGPIPTSCPYAELTPEEQRYDRKMAVDTLKFVVSRGYTIVSPQGDGAN
jgi:hypothetical protein